MFESNDINRSIFSVNDLMMMASIGAKKIELDEYSKAEAVFKLLCDFCPEPSTGPYLGHAMSLFAQGDAYQAQTMLSGLLKKHPQNADIYAHLALINSTLGDSEVALDQIEQAKKYRTDDHLDIIISKVENGQFEPILEL